MQLNQQEQIQLKRTNSPKTPFFTDSKKYIFKFFYLMASIFSAVLLHKVYLFQTLPEFDGVRKGTVNDILYYSIPFGVAFTVFDLGVHYLFDGLCQKYYLDEVKYQGKSRSKRAYTIVKWTYSIVYYFISSIAAYYVLKDSNYFPTWLGGNGSCMNQFMNAPDLPSATYAMKLFYLFQLGKHASRLFSHMFIRQQGNYYEYVLHHSLSTFLIFFSYLTNQWLVGIMVLLCHDASDFFLIIGRGYRDYKNYSKKFLKVIYVLAINCWIMGRLVVFPICCVYSSLFGANQVIDNFSDIQRQTLMLPYRWMGFMLLFLLFLQAFWTYYIAQAFVSVNVSSKIASNTYE